jgi:hypothetical protein
LAISGWFANIQRICAFDLNGIAFTCVNKGLLQKVTSALNHTYAVVAPVAKQASNLASNVAMINDLYLVRTKLTLSTLIIIHLHEHFLR